MKQMADLDLITQAVLCRCISTVDFADIVSEIWEMVLMSSAFEPGVKPAE